MIDPAHIRNSLPPGTKPSTVLGEASNALTTYEGFRGEYQKKNKMLVIAGGALKNSNIDISWLKAACDTFAISDDPNDYILVDVPIVTVDIPNRNMQAFPYEEVSYYDPILGRIIYQTFIGKATNQDHANQQPLEAKGVIFDAAMEFIPDYDVWKIRTLCGFDRTKDANLANAIIRGERPGFSMGALGSAFICSICGVIDTNVNPCKHLAMNRGGGKGSLWSAKNQARIPTNAAYGSNAEDTLLGYQLVCGANFFEISNVGDPADPSSTIAGASHPLWMP